MCNTCVTYIRSNKNYMFHVLYDNNIDVNLLSCVSFFTIICAIVTSGPCDTHVRNSLRESHYYDTTRIVRIQSFLSST
jgi:hypothetical protein